MKIQSQYLDVFYEAQPDCTTIDLKVGDHSQRFAAHHGGLRMIAAILPDDLVGQDKEVEVLSNGRLEASSFRSRKHYHDFLNIPLDPQPYEECKVSSKANLPKSIQWFATWKCNFSCAYCWQETVSESYRKDRPAERSAQEWADAFLRLNPDEIYISGGEPTVHKHMREIVTTIGKGCPVMMTSNLGKSFDLDKWFAEVPAESIGCITFSFHPTQISWADYSRKLRKYVGHYGGSKAGCELVMHPDQSVYKDRVLKLARELEIGTVNIDDYFEQPKTYPRKVDPSAACDQKAIQDGRIEAFASDENHPYYCPAGMIRINVDPVGDAYTCMSAIDRRKMFGRETLPHYTPIGNVFHPEFNWTSDPVLCWETYRCSGCDASKVQSSWRKHSYPYQLPLPH